MKTQKQMYYETHRKLADANNAFMEMVTDPVNPMTRNDLQSLINKRPETYSRFANWLDKLN